MTAAPMLIFSPPHFFDVLKMILLFNIFMQVFSLTIFFIHITSPNKNILLNKYFPNFYIVYEYITH